MGGIQRIIQFDAYQEVPQIHQEAWTKVRNILCNEDGTINYDGIYKLGGCHFQHVAALAHHQQMWHDTTQCGTTPLNTNTRGLESEDVQDMDRPNGSK